MRVLTADTLREILRHFGSEAFFVLLEISHADFSQTYRFVNNLVDFVSDGDTYEARYFIGDLPADQADEITQVDLTIWNGDLLMSDDIRSVVEPYTVIMRIVRAGEPDEFIDEYELEARSVGVAADAVSLTCLNNTVLSGTIGYITITPQRFPARFSTSPGGA